MEILEKQLYQPMSLRVQQNCLQILRNLSDQAVKLVRMDHCRAHRLVYCRVIAFRYRFVRRTWIRSFNC
jgi:hypothetical protein